MQDENEETAFEPLSDDELRFLAALDTHQVRAVVIGGYAARVHGVRDADHLRGVEDLDLVIDNCDENLDRFGLALEVLKVRDVANVTAQFRQNPKVEWQWRDGRDDHFVDVLSAMDVAGFAELWDAGVSVEHENLRLRVIGKLHFIEAKRRALADPGRGPKAEQDRRDVNALLGTDKTV